MAKYPGFIGPSYSMASLPIDCQRTINWYPEKQGDENASSLYVLQPTPGYALDVDLSTVQGVSVESSIRGYYRTSRGLGINSDESIGSRIVVCGPAVIWLKYDNSYQWLGSVSDLASTVSMVDDGFGMILVDGTSMYRLDMETLIFSQVFYDLQSPTTVVYLGSYTLAIGTVDGVAQNSFFWSAQDDNASWDALSYASAESCADPITNILVNGSYLWLFGPNSFEVWSATGDKDLPFARSYAAAGTIGLAATRSLLSVGNNVLMIGSTTQGCPVAYMSQGTSFNKISTLALEQEWSKTSVADCVSFAYSAMGHTFVLFNFDLLDKTYCYDITDGQGQWSERATRNPADDTLHRWAPQFCMQTSGVTTVGDRYRPRILVMSNEILLEDGNPILRVRTSAHLQAAQKYFRVQSVTFCMETGTGISNQDPIDTTTGVNRFGQAPTMMFRYSWDYGRTYSSERREPFGAMGEFRTMLQYRKLGRGRDLVVEYKVSDACKTAVTNGWVDYEEGGQKT